VFVFAPYLLLLLGSLVPRVKDPLPDEIGLEFLFYASGVGGALGGILFAFSSKARRDWAIKWGGVLGFGFGLLAYLISLLVQLSSQL
jgi:hypothetical protein